MGEPRGCLPQSPGFITLKSGRAGRGDRAGVPTLGSAREIACDATLLEAPGAPRGSAPRVMRPRGVGSREEGAWGGTALGEIPNVDDGVMDAANHHHGTCIPM